MDGLLTEVKTVTRDSRPALDTAASSRDHGLEGRRELDTDTTSSGRILGMLKSKPDRSQLFDTLTILDPSNKEISPKDFDIQVPGPTTAQVLQILVSTTIPDHWNSLNVKSEGHKSKDTKLRAALLRCLSSVAGLSSLVAQLRSLIAASRSSSQQAKGSGSLLLVKDTLAVLSALLQPKNFLFRLYTDISATYNNETQKQITWKELVALVAASRVLLTAAEAFTLIKDLNDLNTISWVGEGHHYASWLGGNICHMASKIDLNDQGGWKAVASLTGRSLSLGYTDHLVREIYLGLLIDQSFPKQFGLLLDSLRTTEQITILEAVFRDVEKKHFSEEIYGGMIEAQTSNPKVNGIAALWPVVIGNRTNIEIQIVDWLCKGQGGSIQTAGLRRSLLVHFADNQDALRSLLTRSLEQSADKFYIKHAPSRSQEANTQVLLLAAGYLNRLNSAILKEVGRSSIFLNVVSNRLAASSTRARFLGMIIGTAISQLIEEPGKGMKFDLEEMESEEAHWYLNLLRTEDEPGSLGLLKEQKDSAPKANRPTKKSSSTPAQSQTTKIVAIEEIEDSANEDEEEEEDDDLIPYEKPDDDPSDSDEDPTLIQRNKPTVPVYIRDLITCLRDTENIERYHLGIENAPSLIRRKTGFGTELTENIEELALVITGLQDQNKLAKFHEYRLQSMIALIVAQPVKMGRWFTAMFFDGDISQIQRSAVLTALGLSARELAGNGEEDARVMGLPEISNASFPSKKLSANLEALYATDESPVASLTRKLAQTSLQPLAANAADAVSGPNALKVRTFSSRMEVEKKRQQREAQRQKSTVKDIQKVLSEGFFYPLKGRFEMMMMQFSS
ncbi:telomere binding protein [Aspergillus wentii]|nr:telomere binding protein [Aspergillus wentii]